MQVGSGLRRNMGRVTMKGRRDYLALHVGFAHITPPLKRSVETLNVPEERTSLWHTLVSPPALPVHTGTDTP